MYNQIIGGNSRLVRSINRSTISQADISRITRLNKSTVSSIVFELLEANLLEEEFVQDNNVGRNPVQLSLKLNSYFVGAINFDTNIIRIAILDIDGKISVQKEFVPSKITPEECVKESMSKLALLKKQLGIEFLEGIGVTISGLIDPKTGYVLVASNLGWKEVNLGDLFRKYQNGSKIIRFENDAEASALAELWFGSGEITQYANFVFLSVGAGIGSGIVINRKVIEGVSYAAGEFGHITIFENGKRCVCGGEGCWEAYASDRATGKRYLEMKNIKEYDKAFFKIQDVLNAAQNGDELAINALKETGKFLGIGIANVIKALDPPAIVIGGRILQSWDLIYPEIMEGLSKRSFFGLEKQVKILPSSLTERPRLLGAATLALEDFFTDYKIIK